MARKPKEQTPSAAVRLAFTGPTVEHDQLIDKAAAFNDEDRKRASSAGESRAKIKTFLDETGINSKALSWLRQVLKTSDKDDGQAKAMDIIMSLEKCLPMIKAHVAGQGTMPMELEPAGPSYSEDFDPTDDSLPNSAATDEEWDAAGQVSAEDEPVEPADDEWLAETSAA